MKKIVLLLILISGLFASVIKSPIISIDSDTKTVKINIDRIDVGMSGFIVHKLDDSHSVILKSVVVTAYDKESKIAILDMSEYTALENDALPKGRWAVEVGDSVVLAIGYKKALLIAPSEDIYHKITKNSQSIEWMHPDIFATLLSIEGHPTPLKEDFSNMCTSTSVGILFFYLNQKVFTLDCLSFKILNISDSPLIQDDEKLPFYTRIEEIDADWWGEGSDELTSYAPHYYKLMIDNNQDNKELYKIVENFKTGDE